MAKTPSGATPDLSIIIPAYKEAELIQSTLHALANWLKSHDYRTVEVIVTVADSPDDTAKLARACSREFAHLRVLDVGPRQGKGHNVREGMLAATGKYRLFMDADLATPIHNLESMWQLMLQNPDVIIAVRPLAVIHKDWLRKTVTLGGNLLTQVVLLPGISDTQCGFKAFRADVAEAVFTEVTVLGWGFDLETLALVRKLRYRIQTINVDDWHDPKAINAGLTGDSVIRVSLQVLRNLFQIRWWLLTGKYRQVHPKKP